jgi:hypothetical protein
MAMVAYDETELLKLLTDGAKDAGLQLARPPWYDPRQDRYVLRTMVRDVRFERGELFDWDVVETDGKRREESRLKTGVIPRLVSMRGDA